MTRNVDPITVAYIVKGFWSKADEIALDASRLCTAGEIGLMEYLTGLEEIDSEAFSALGEFHLVWAYHISEPLGEWVAEQAKMHGTLPDKDAVRRQTQHLIELAAKE